jgi:hypothetical protein
VVLPQKCAYIVDLLVFEMSEPVACNPAHFTVIAAANWLSSAHQAPELVAPVHCDNCQ